MPRVVPFVATFLFFATLLPSCAHTTPGPYTVEYDIGEWTGVWFSDEAPSVLGVFSREDCPVAVVVACATGDGGENEFTVDLPPHGMERVIFQKLARDYAVNMCHRKSWVCR